MATQPYSILERPGNLAYQWDLAAGDDGVQVAHTDSGDRTVQVTGTFGGATVLVEGSLDGSNWFTLRDAPGVALSFTSPGLRSVLENAPLIRARAAGGDGTTAIVVILNTRR